MNAPLVSVLMAARNAASTLDRQVECVLGQRGVSLELLMCDDASTDATFDRMRRHASDPRVRILRNRSRLHAAATRNRLLALARGRYCSPCDADDLLMPDALSSLAASLEAHPRAGLAYGTLIQVFTEPRRNVTPRIIAAGRPGWDLFAHHASHAGSVIRTRLLREVGGYDPGLRLAEDRDLFLKLRERAEFVALPGLLTYVWRVHPRSSGRIRRDRHRIIEGILRRAAERRLKLGLDGL